MKKASGLRPLTRAVLRTQPDHRLVTLAREGREAAFEEIVRRYRPGLVAFAAAYAPSERAEDVVQESLVRSWEALGKSTEEIHLKPWLYTIVRNRALNARRDAKIHAPLSDEIDGVPQPPDVVLSGEELAAVVSAVARLPEPQREALVRSALEGHTHEQIAGALGSSPGAVRQLIYRARVNLRTAAGLMIPLPLVRLLAEHSGETASAASIAAGGAALGASGASAISKLALVAAVGTLAAGAGVAIEESASDPERSRAQAVNQDDARSQAGDDATGSGQGASAAAESGPGESAAGGGDSESEGAEGGGGDDDRGTSGDDSSGAGSGDGGDADDDRELSDSSGPGGEGSFDDGDRSGPGAGGSPSSGPGPSDDFDGDHSGPGGGGSGSGTSGSGSGTSGSGSGTSGSGSGSGTSGSGSGTSGSGSGISGSGTSGSGTSGSGSGGGELDFDGSSGSGSGPGSGSQDPLGD